MANYIDKNILSQAYIHIERDEDLSEKIEKIKDNLRDFALTRGQFFLYEDIEVDIETKSGSIILYATFLGTIATMYQGIAQYPSFREGAIQIFEDSKRLADYIISEALFSTRSKHSQVRRAEARVGIIGSIKKIINKLDSIKNRNGLISAKQMLTKLQSAREDIDKLLNNIRTEKDRALVIEGFRQIINTLPRKPANQKGKTDDPTYVNAYIQELEALKKILK